MNGNVSATSRQPSPAALFQQAAMGWLSFYFVWVWSAALNEFRINRALTWVLQSVGIQRDIQCRSLDEISAPIRANSKALWSRAASAFHPARHCYKKFGHFTGIPTAMTSRATGRQSGQRRTHGGGGAAKKASSDDPGGGDGGPPRHTPLFILPPATITTAPLATP